MSSRSKERTSRSLRALIRKREMEERQALRLLVESRSGYDACRERADALVEERRSLSQRLALEPAPVAGAASDAVSDAAPVSAADAVAGAAADAAAVSAADAVAVSAADAAAGAAPVAAADAAAVSAADAAAAPVAPAAAAPPPPAAAAPPVAARPDAADLVRRRAYLDQLHQREQRLQEELDLCRKAWCEHQKSFCEARSRRRVIETLRERREEERREEARKGIDAAAAAGQPLLNDWLESSGR
ncbi:MAG: hypothetical protein JXA90_08865 [Planctomycetes bacterium]|nr:hypothetical protein [Planctomycetota bacterium]